MRLTLDQLEAFFWVAKLGSVHAAARYLHFTQPAITARLRGLESALGLRLFERQHQRLELTDDGRRALIYAQRSLGASQDLVRFGKKEGADRGVLRLGTDEAGALVAMGEILARLKSRHPDLRVELTVGVGTFLSEKLARRELDIALHTGQGFGEHVLHQLLGFIEFQWAASPSLQRPDGPLTPSEAAGLPIVTNPAPSTLHSIVAAWLREGGRDFEAYNTCTSLWLMLHMAQIGHAIALLPVPILRERIARGDLVVLEAQPPVPPTAYFVSYQEEERGNWLHSLIEMIKDVIRESKFLSDPAPMLMP